MLGPHVVGARVVVRRVLRGETGPSGGPAMTDVLGVCESWVPGAGGRTTIRREDGSLEEIALADIVSGKPVPPRPSVRMRVDADEVDRRAARQLRPRETELLGDWLLRCTGGRTGRSNSVLPVGDPGVPFSQALEQVGHWYAARDRTALAQISVDSPAHERFAAHGWVPARPDEADSALQLGSVARARRLLGRPAIEVVRAEQLTRAWLRGNDGAQANFDAVATQLDTDDVVFSSVVRDDQVVARGRATYEDGWAGLTDLWVDPQLRRSGLARAIIADLLEWAAERGASTVLLQVLSDNEPALALYGSLGLETHHLYRYLQPG